MVSMPDEHHYSDPFMSQTAALYAYRQSEETNFEVMLKSLNVKISPSNMKFYGAYEGKKYHQKLTIQNCGEKSAFVRICPSSSYSFQIKPIVRGKTLSPGLSIVRYVSYVYMRATSVPYAHIPIYINGNQINYRLAVLVSEVMISAIPQNIDFGTIDAGYSAAVRMLSLRNDGNKSARFAIDLGRNEFELIVEPTKGVIQPQQTVKFRVECLGTREGCFKRELWIECETPLRIGVEGRIIKPKIDIFHPNTTQDFTLVDFPKTYYGTYCIKTLIILNVSAMASIYCTVAELLDGTVNLSEAHKFRKDFQNFTLHQIEGNLLPHEGRIFRIVYAPIKAPYTRKGQSSYSRRNCFCWIQIMRVSCTDLNLVKIPGNLPVSVLRKFICPVVENIPEIILDPEQRCSTTNEETVSGILSLDEEKSLMDYQTETSNVNCTIPLQQMVRVVLHGEAEDASIKITPDALNLEIIEINKSTARELLLTNQNSNLPIIFNYKNVCWVKVEPNSGLLKPSGTIEVNVTVIPTKIGLVKTKLVFDIFYVNQPREDDGYVHLGSTEIPLTFKVLSTTTTAVPRLNTGIHPEYIKEVGYNADDVRFSTRVPMPKSTLINDIEKTLNKDDNDLVAFPNDRPKSLRAWKNKVNCRTICAGISRYVNAIPDEYELSTSQAELKLKQRNYYHEYTSRQAKQLRKSKSRLKAPPSDYSLTNKSALLLDKVQKIKCKPHTRRLRNQPPSFIPLTPLELNNVTVSPSNIKLKKMVPNSSSTRKVTVRNQNNFSIRILVKSRKPLVSFPHGPHMIVKPSQEADIKFTYNSGSTTGRRNLVMDFIVNDNHTFAVSLSIEIVQSHVRLERNDIIFNPNLCSYKCLDVFNPVNVPIAFYWKVPNSRFKFETQSVVISPYRHLNCVISYVPEYHLPSSIEATLCSENGLVQTVNVTADLIAPKVAFKHSKIEIKNIPLNLPVTATMTLKNLGSEPVTFLVRNTKPLAGVNVTPTKGIFRGYSEQTFTISIKLGACITFNCQIEIDIQNMKVLKGHIFGNVVFPNISISPSILQLKKIVSSSFDNHPFVVTNKSLAKATLKFCLEDCVEYTILETQEFDVRLPSIKKIDLEPEEQKQLYLHFNPLGASIYSFYLPFIINDMLGPAFMNLTETHLTSTYTSEEQNNYSSEHNVALVKIPDLLPLVTIKSVVAREILRFSNLDLHFKYYPHPYYKSETEHDIRIWNASKDTCKFCIGTEEICAPFSLDYVSGKNIRALTNSISCKLEPDEEVVLKAAFDPQRSGDYYAKLPIYLKQFSQEYLFNVMCFTAIFPMPEIKAIASTIYLEPVPIDYKSETNFSLLKTYHFDDCEMFVETILPELQVHLSDELVESEMDFFKRVLVEVSCSFHVPKAFECDIRFYCTCGGESHINVVGCFDNCSLTTHAFLKVYTNALFANSAAPAKRESSTGNVREPRSPNVSNEIRPSFTDTVLTIPSMCSSLPLDINYKDSTFPIFPCYEEENEYGIHMKAVLTALEEWLFHQCFSSTTYYKIPKGFAQLSERLVHDKDKKATVIYTLTLVELLTRLVGPDIRKYIPIREMPEEPIHRVNYMYNVYTAAKKFITNQGGHFIHVMPEYLLAYSDYEIYMKYVLPNRDDSVKSQTQKLMPETKFKWFSKQCWLDVILQAYMVFVLARVRFPPEMTEIGSNETRLSLDLANYRGSKSSIYSKSIGDAVHLIDIKNDKSESTSSKQGAKSLFQTLKDYKAADIHDFWLECSHQDHTNRNIYNTSEYILLYWLEYHYNQYRNILWGPNGCISKITPPLRKNIKFFDFDLNDGLVFIVITIVYCPYLVPYLEDIYLCPDSTEEMYHNVYKLLESWKRIKLSFVLNPSQIVHPNPVQMLLLINYLYNVLPLFSVESTLRFKTGLSTVCTQSVIVENPSKETVCYNVIFIGNESRHFSVLTEKIIIKPRGKTNLKIKYCANKLAIQKATVILNGESSKYKYARSIVFMLHGEPIPSHVSATVEVPLPLYTFSDVNLQINNPYKNSGVYNIYYFFEEPTDVRTCKIRSWEDEKHRRVPKILFSRLNSVEFNEDGVGDLQLGICCITSTEKDFWLIFRNAEAGDFIIKVKTVTNPNIKQYVPVLLQLPDTFETYPCFCKDAADFTKIRCPRTLTIEVPCRNVVLWDAVKELILNICDKRDLDFWKKYQGSNAGIHIIKWSVMQPHNQIPQDIKKLFKDRVHYELIKELPSSDILLPSDITIEDVYCPNYHKIPVHLDITDNIPDVRFTLRSNEKLEDRHFQVCFLPSTNISVNNPVNSVENSLTEL